MNVKSHETLPYYWPLQNIVELGENVHIFSYAPKYVSIVWYIVVWNSGPLRQM